MTYNATAKEVHFCSMNQLIIGRRTAYGVRALSDELRLPDISYMPNRLANWTHNYESLEALFGKRNPLHPSDTDRLIEKHSKVSSTPGERNTIYCSIESPWGAAGGILPVARESVRALIACGENVTRVCPRFKNLQSRFDVSNEMPIAICKVEYGGVEHLGKIYEAFEKDGERWLQLDTPHFFNADGGPRGTDPYMYSDETREQRDGADSKHMRDSLFFSKALPEIACALGIRENVVFALQEWQCAGAVVPMNEYLLEGKLESAKAFLFCHNTGDHWCPEWRLAELTKRWQTQHWQPINGCNRETFYQRFMPLMNGPIVTVSRMFAREMLEHPIQKVVLAPQLPEFLGTQGLVGCNNRLFRSVNLHPYSESVRRAAKNGDPREILEIKRRNREQLFKVYRHLDPRMTFGTLQGPGGSPLENLPETTPIFMMSGRADRAQKGFDTLSYAIDEFLTKSSAKFIIIAMVTGTDYEDQMQLEHFHCLADRHPGDIVVHPYRMTEGYMEIMAGADYVVYPSRYEPWGGASEAMVNGTLVIGKRTGGLDSQILDFSEYGPHKAVGFSYDDNIDDGVDIPGELLFIHQEPRFDYLYKHSRLYRNMATSLSEALIQAASIKQKNPELYGLMLANLKDQLSWLSWEEHAVPEMREIFKCV